MKNNVLYIMCGLPFSGKTTLAYKIAKKLGFKIVSQDKILFSMGHDFEKSEQITNEVLSKLFKEIYSQIANLLKNGETVIYDAANKSTQGRENLKKHAEGLNKEMKVIWIDVPLLTIMERWNTNQHSKERFQISENQLQETIKNFEPPATDPSVIKYTPKEDIDEWILKNIKSN